MDFVQINLNDKIHNITPLTVISMREVDGRLLVVYREKANHRIGIGQTLSFRRYVYDERDQYIIYESTVVVEEKLTASFNGGRNLYDAVFTTLPADTELELYIPVLRNHEINVKGMVSAMTRDDVCTEDGDAYFDALNGNLMIRAGGDYYPNDWIHFYSGGTEEYFVLRFAEDHKIFAQDIAHYENVTGEEYTIDVRDRRGSIIGSLGGVKIPKDGVYAPVSSADTLTKTKINTCGQLGVGEGLYEAIEYKYSFLPDSFSRDSIIFTSAQIPESGKSFFDATLYLLTSGWTFTPRANPFYFTTMESGWSECHLWQDGWWIEYNSKNSPELHRYYVNSGDNRTIFGLFTAYWNVPMLELSHDNDSLAGEDAQYNYVDRIIDSAIPDVIDMERFKYKPSIGGIRDSVSSIIFDFHFRSRAAIEMRRGKLANNEEYPIYDDGWHVDVDSASTIWWNGFNCNKAQFDGAAFSEYIEASGKTSDLVGYLNFTDDDIYYRKSRVSKSFVRLSFYTSTDPLEQKLLYYSTIFLDATTLHGKFMKQYLYRYETYGEFETTPIVFMSKTNASAVLDTEIVIHDESDATKSSEGFNIYLFGADAQEFRTIYMKVEFNHAGNGKTIPMMLWPKDANGNYRPVMNNSFLEDLYIPIELRYLEDRGDYVYSIKGAIEDSENNSIRLILFEPKLDTEDYYGTE